MMTSVGAAGGCLRGVLCSCGMAPWQQLEEVGIAPVVDFAWQPIRRGTADLVE